MKKFFLTIWSCLFLSAQVHAEIITGASCAKTSQDDCYWTFDTESKTLTISGTGSMQDYGEAYRNAPGISGRPWHSLSSQIENVVVESGITAIGNRSFEFMQNLKSIRIDGDITTAGFGALSNNANLETVVISGTSLNYNDITINATPKLKNLYCSKENEAMCQAILENSSKNDAQISNILKTYSQNGSGYFYDSKWYATPGEIFIFHQ